MTLLSSFKDYLKKKALPVTSEREKIAELISQIECHFTIEDLLKEANAKEMDISRATVYRTVQLLMDSNLLIKLQRKDKPPVYETTVNRNPHYHLMCTKCGNLIEFESRNIDKIAEKICLNEHFINTKMSFKIFGHCEKCSGK